MMTTGQFYDRQSYRKKAEMMPVVCGNSQHARAGTAEGH